MSKLFTRKAIAIVDSLEVEGLRIQFKAHKTLQPEPNTLDLSITNLSRETRAHMQKKGAKVVVLAGYESAFSTVFSGDARTVDHVRQGPEWITRIQCGDGETAYSSSRIAEAFKPGTKLTDVLPKVASSLGVGLGNAVDKIKEGNFRGAMDQFVNGLTVSGKARRELDKLLMSAGFEWSIQDGQLQLLRPGEVTKHEAPLLSPDTGLIGSPEHGTPKKPFDPPVLKVKCLLQPTITPGRQIRIQCFGIDGYYRAEKVTHSGDTHGADWYTEIEALPINAAI